MRLKRKMKRLLAGAVVMVGGAALLTTVGLGPVMKLLPFGDTPLGSIVQTADGWSMVGNQGAGSALDCDFTTTPFKCDLNSNSLIPFLGAQVLKTSAWKMILVKNGVEYLVDCYGQEDSANTKLVCIPLEPVQ